MNKLRYIPLILVALAIGILQFQGAPQKKEARVTQVIKDVRLLTSRAASRPASVNDMVNENSAVRTGNESRAEITFMDQTLTRLGANTVFSFNEGGRGVDLMSGAILLAAPENTGTTKVKMVGVATAAISGFAAMFETHRNSQSKVIVLDGEGTITLDNIPGSLCPIHAGQMMVIPAHPVTCPPVYDINIAKLVGTAKLVTLWPLPPWILDPVLHNADKQKDSGPNGGYVDPTSVDPMDQHEATELIIKSRPQSTPCRGEGCG